MSNIKISYYNIVRIIACLLVLLFSVQHARAAIIVGNPKGSVTLDFVYDYQCMYCHRMFPIVQELISKNHNLRVRLYPVAVLNNNSLLEAATAIAATKIPGKFQELTNSLMSQQPLQKSEIQALLHRLSLDNHSFMLSAHSQWVKKQLLEGLKLLRQGHSKSVPVFIVSKSDATKSGPTVLIGEQSYKDLAGVIEHARRI